MKPCPHCRRLIPPTAVRCRHCRRPLISSQLPAAISVWSAFQRQTRVLDRIYREPRPSLVSLLEALGLTMLVLIGSWILSEKTVMAGWIEFLRANFFVFTKEPLLQSYVYLFSETFVLKLGALGLVLTVLAVKGQDPRQALALGRPLRRLPVKAFYAYGAFCVAAALLQGMDPLVPDLPTSLFFRDSALIGNGAAFLSIVVVAPVIEEIFFRGFLYPALARRFGWLGSVLVTSLLFTGAHAHQMSGEWFWLAMVLTGSLAMTWARAYTGSTACAIYMHFAYNGCLVLYGIMRFFLYEN